MKEKEKMDKSGATEKKHVIKKADGSILIINYE